MIKINDKIKRNREAIKPKWTDLYHTETPKKQNLEKPSQFKEASDNAVTIRLNKEFPNIKQKSLTECIANRRSLREYLDLPLTLEELSYLLWETSRVISIRENAVFRTIPTAGATNSMETYVYINSVKNVDNGIYLYLQNKHDLALVRKGDMLSELVNDSLLGQLRGAQVVFFFTCIPARTEYKYDFCAHKMIAIESGHACQNLSLSAEIIDSGACAICAYDQEKVDDLLKLDSNQEFTTYCVTLGKKK